MRLYWARDERPEFAEYPTKTVRIHVDLSSPAAAEVIQEVCQREQAAMLEWLEVQSFEWQRLQPRFNGTFASLIALYEHDLRSSFQDTKQNSQQSYRDSFKIITATIGARRLDCVQPIYFRTCYREWQKPVAEGGPLRTRRAYGCVQMLRNALTYGVEAGLPHCARLRDGLSRMRFAKPAPREESFSFAQVAAIVEVALIDGDVSLALTQALQFECLLRQADVIGMWRYELNSYELKSGEIRSGRKVWAGMTIGMISVERMLKVRTSKTAQFVAHDLSKCNLVMRCLEKLDSTDRDRPVASRSDGTPWPDRQSFARHWRGYADRAGVPRNLLNMDARASGITEAAIAGASDDDLANTAGHTSKATTRRIYKRAAPQISNRVQSARQRSRESEEGDA